MNLPSRYEIRGLGSLLLAAAIWGFAFVAQREGMRHIGPFTFNALRFAMGGLAILPWFASRGPGKEVPDDVSRWTVRMGILSAGVVLFASAALQQIGLVSTTAGKAGFITGLYVVIVPLLSLLWRHRVPKTAWAGCLLATVGMYLLTVTDGMSIAAGDVLVLASAVGWAVHVHLAGWLVRHVRAVRLAVLQFAICSLLSSIVAIIHESLSVSALREALWPLAYAGVVSVGIAYTLQLVGQRTVPPSQAGVVMSLEAAFAVLGGWFFLAETLTPRGLVGCGLMMAGMALAQLRSPARNRIHPSTPIP